MKYIHYFILCFSLWNISCTSSTSAENTNNTETDSSKSSIPFRAFVDSILKPDNSPSFIYSSDGEELGFYFLYTSPVLADYTEISPNIVNAFIAIEESYNEEPSDIDMIYDITHKSDTTAQRGSAIAKQLAKLLSQPEENIFELMDQEERIAVELDRFYSQNELIKIYLSQLDFLYNAIGIKSAAQVYFGKDAKDLNIEEAAMLIGMIENPYYYNPIRYPDRSRDRRNTVLSLMGEKGMITEDELISLKKTPLNLNFHRFNHKKGPAPYFREELRRYLTAERPVRSNYFEWEHQKYVDDSIAWEINPLFGWIEKNPKPDGSKYDIYSDGLKIYTTIDSRMQRYAEEAVEEHMKSLQQQFFEEKKNVKNAPYTTNREELPLKQLEILIDRALKHTDRYRIMKKAGASEDEINRAFNTPREMSVFSYNGQIDTIMTPRDSVLYNKHFLRAGFMSMDPVTGYVKAYVGGPDFSNFQYDMVSTGRRQIGSTIKPFLYAYAMEEGFTPCDQFVNEQPILTDEYGREWAPRNSSHAREGEMVDLRWVLTNSNNWISARLMNELSPTQLARNMHNFGITNHIDPVVSLCLGPCDVSVKEMVGAYSAFANKGMRAEPVFVSAIADSNGKIISEFKTTISDVISPNAYWKILSMLLDVVDNGAGKPIRLDPYNITAQMGGYTGATISNSDGWFMGFTPQLVSGVWVGGEERFIHFNAMANGHGAAMALPVYGLYMSKVYKDKTLPYSEKTKFKFPANYDPCRDKIR